MIYLEKTDIHCTMTTYLYCNFAMLWSAEQQEYNNVLINWEKGKFVKSYEDLEKYKEIPNAYDWYFIQPKTPNPAAGSREVWTWEYDGDRLNGFHLMAQPLKVIKDYYKKHLHFNEETNKRGQAIVEKYGIELSKTIGLTWRGTDIYLDGRPRINIETYFRFIDGIMEDNPNYRIACTAEEEKILDPLLARYPNAFLIEEFYQAPYEHKHNPERFSPMSGYERGLQPVLMVWLFSKCAHYIKNRSSTGAVASWLSDGRIISIAHPENLGFPANTNTAEIEGKLYPLNL